MGENSAELGFGRVSSFFLLFCEGNCLGFSFRVVVLLLLLVVVRVCWVLVQLESVEEFGKLDVWEVLFDVTLPVLVLGFGLGVLEFEEFLLFLPGCLCCFF